MKNNILQKTERSLLLLQDAQEILVKQAGESLPRLTATAWTPKLSRGENYQGLPYRVLDYPRFFDAGSMLCVRQFFWWGHFFSSTLLLAGDARQDYEEKILAAYDRWAGFDYHICVHPDSPWEHHFGTDNYLPIKKMTSSAWEEVICKKDFIKLASRYKLSQWDQSQELLLSSFHLYLSIFAV